MEAALKKYEIMGRTQLHTSVDYRKNKLTPIKVLIANGADINAKDDTGNTPLHYAANSGHAKGAALLIKAGADIEAKNNKGWTPLQRACIDGHLEIIEVLIASDADVNAPLSNGLLPLDILYRAQWVRFAVFPKNGKKIYNALAAAGAEFKKYCGTANENVAEQEADFARFRN